MATSSDSEAVATGYCVARHGRIQAGGAQLCALTATLEAAGADPGWCRAADETMRRAGLVPISGTRHGGGIPRLSGCPLKVHVCGPPTALQALWCCGIGQMSTAGFGWVQHDEPAASEPALDRDTAAHLCATLHPSRTEALHATARLRAQGRRVHTAVRPQPRPDGTLPVATVYDPHTNESLGELKNHLRRSHHGEGGLR